MDTSPTRDSGSKPQDDHPDKKNWAGRAPPKTYYYIRICVAKKTAYNDAVAELTAAFGQVNTKKLYTELAQKEMFTLVTDKIREEFGDARRLPAFETDSDHGMAFIKEVAQAWARAKAEEIEETRAQALRAIGLNS